MDKSPVEAGLPDCSRRRQFSVRAWASPVAWAGAVLAFGAVFPHAVPARETLPVCQLQIASPTGAHRFDVEVASTPRARRRGLMGRKSLTQGHGMLFVFDEEERLAMWMKNTLIPLDMLFFDSNGAMVHIERKAEPHSLRRRQAPAPVRYVLEINGGEGQSLSVDSGAQLDREILKECLGRRGG